MPTFNCSDTYGTVPDNATLDLINDDPDLLVTSVSRSGTREKEEYRSGSSRCVTGVDYYNPRFTVGVSGNVLGIGDSTVGSVTDKHPGTSVTSASNFATTYFGFTIADGMTFHEEPNLEASTDNAPTFSYNLEHYPFVASGA